MTPFIQPLLIQIQEQRAAQQCKAQATMNRARLAIAGRYCIGWGGFAGPHTGYSTEAGLVLTFNFAKKIFLEVDRHNNSGTNGSCL